MCVFMTNNRIGTFVSIVGRILMTTMSFQIPRASYLCGDLDGCDELKHYI